jgi:hypothetical protein
MEAPAPEAAAPPPSPAGRELGDVSAAAAEREAALPKRPSGDRPRPPRIAVGNAREQRSSFGIAFLVVVVAAAAAVAAYLLLS